MKELAVNPVTGFLESNQGSSFNSPLKVKFLELANLAVDNKCMPDVPAICKALDIHTRTFYQHKQTDEAFNRGWQEILDRCESALVQTMYTNGQRPSGYMDRITWLRAHRPAMWNPDLKVNISHDSSQVKSLQEACSTAIEAEIVDNPAPIATHLQPPQSIVEE